MSDASDPSTPIWQRNLWGHSDVTGSDGVTRRTHEMRDSDGTWHSLDRPASVSFEHCGARVRIEPLSPMGMGPIRCPLCGRTVISSDAADFAPWVGDPATGEALDDPLA